MIKRGDVVILDFPFVGGGAGKTRPAVVVQCDRLNQRIENTIVAMITGNTSQIGKEPTQFLIDSATPDGAGSGLKLPSAVRCQNLATVAQADIHATIGHLSDALKQKLSDCLKATLDLP
jgi:mRNA-degrading endonuclease toxin of MazEF toxin-antitoxin module